MDTFIWQNKSDNSNILNEMKKTGLILIFLLMAGVFAYVLFLQNKEGLLDNKTEIVSGTMNKGLNDNSSGVQALPVVSNNENSQNAQATASIIFDGNSARIEGSGALVEGNKVTITESGIFDLSGTLDDGQLVINTDSSEPVELIFNGVSLHSSSTSPFYVQNAQEVLILLKKDSENSITDGESYTKFDAGTDEPNAALFSKDDLTIEGEGKLVVKGNFGDAIAVKDKLKIKSGIIDVTSVDDGIRSRDKLTIKSGEITVNSQGDGLKSNNDEESTKGNIKIDGGIFNITSAGDAIQAESDIKIDGGIFNLKTSSVRNSAGIYSSTKGLNAGDSLIINAEDLTINSVDDAVHSNNYLEIQSGSFTINTNDDGIHADSLLIINGGTINIESSYEGIESQVVRINGGDISLRSSDDGFSIASGGGGQMGWGRRGGGGAGNNFLYINGGFIYINANGDGVDANGSVEMTAGTLLVSGPTASMNGALDYDGTFKITGGMIVAAGSSGMAQAPGSNSTQNSVLVYLSSAQDAGTPFHLQKGNGEKILSFVPPKYYQSVAISSPELKSGEEYDVYVGGNVSGESKNGLYLDGDYSSGTKLISFTIDNITTTVGSGGSRFGRGGFGGFRR